jgi:membrane-bound lytic murein transglycosylase D
MELTKGSRLALLISTILAVAACAHAPADRTLEGPAYEPRGVNVPPAPAPETLPAEPEPLVADVPWNPSSQSTPAASETPVEEPTPVAGLTPAQYADLFDRIRAGFKLDEVDRLAVTQQLMWYAANPDYLERAFGRAELYLYHIVTEIEARGMPLELALLPVVESAFEPYAYSRARASGLWQFIPGTGSRFGLKQGWWYDGRRDVVESTRAALEYLQYLHDEFDGDWLLAVAGYNCGESAVARAIAANRAAGRPTDFWSLKLPKETRAYVPKLLAMKKLVASPENHGLAFSSIVNQPYFERVETLGQIDLKLAAELAGITYEELFELNPAFHRWATDPAGPHYLLLPTEGASLFRSNIGQLTPEARVRATLYTVQKGDSVSSVARHHNTTISVIRELNDLPTGVLTIGSQLRVPSTHALPPKVLRAAAIADGKARRSSRHVHVVRSGDSLWRIARNNGISVNTLAMMNGMQPGDTLRKGQKLRLTSNSSSSSSSAAARADGSGNRKVTYTVRSGDTLSRIAKLFQVSVAQITTWNGISSRSTIKPGQKLTIRVSSRRS